MTNQSDAAAERSAHVKRDAAAPSNWPVVQREDGSWQLKVVAELQAERDDLAKRLKDAERERNHQHSRADRNATLHAVGQKKREQLQAENARLRNLREMFVNLQAALINGNALLRDALRDLLSYVERGECTHENTHRGGTIWTICDECGKKWADDEGGFKPYCEPIEITKARMVLGGKP
jgi:hypothetical protein